ncbi:hypothetical protein [Bacillus rhizoplanae]|uniref:hypothetical protein n=1 Tax=Bacillus rhizoplanae TaxID=2880966 RepID=UPI003D2226BB
MKEKGESYKQEVARIENVTTNVSVPRGKIYDRYHRVIVENKPLRTISYTRSKSSRKEDSLEIAFSVVVPWVVNDTENPVNKKIGKRILEAYFESQKVKK